MDRIENDKGYSPGNCRFVDGFAQQNNRRDNVYYTDLDGDILTVAELSRKHDISRSALGGRLNRGWSMQKALNTPIAVKNKSKP